MDTYEVIVGNVGSVYAGTDRKEALRTFDAYRDQSKSDIGRAGGETVTLLKNDDIHLEYVGKLDREALDCPHDPSAIAFRGQ